MDRIRKCFVCFYIKRLNKILTNISLALKTLYLNTEFTPRHLAILMNTEFSGELKLCEQKFNQASIFIVLSKERG